MTDLSTDLVNDHGQFKDPHGAVVPPVYQNSTFTFESWDAVCAAFDDPSEAFVYSRGNNPTVRLTETKIAALCGADDARLFATGMAAVSAVCLHCVSQGGHVIVVRNVYGPTRSLFHDYLAPKLGLSITEVDGRHLAEFRDALRDETQLIYLESPSSRLFTLQDLPGVADLARQRGVATAIDNSWASPLFQKPLRMGIDYEIHSCTKYLGGHSDLMGGAVAGSSKAIRGLHFEYLHLGASMSPHVAAMLLRSLRTLPLRMRQHEANTQEVVRYLNTHPKVERVLCPALPEFEQADLFARQMTGCGGLFSFRLKSDREEDTRTLVDALSLFGLGVSWGGHESLVFVPAIAYSREQPAERMTEDCVTLRDVRLSIGLESSKDLIADLRQALERVP